MNTLITEDGYMFQQVQGTNGWFTDGDMEFEYANTDIVGMVWQCMDGSYCADGDGIVTVDSDEHGWFYVVDQGDPIAEYDNLRDALMCAMRQLAEHYPEVYASRMA